MGNAEARALAASDHSIMVDAVLAEHQELLSATNRQHYIDRARFGLFFDVEKSAVPFRLIDQLFDAALAASQVAEEEMKQIRAQEEEIRKKRRFIEGSAAGGVPSMAADQVSTDAHSPATSSEEKILFSQLVLPLVVSIPTIPVEEKVRMLFHAADPTFGQERQVLVEELSLAIQRLLTHSVRRLRGHEVKPGVIEYRDRRCQGCGEVPKNASFECRDCFNGHTILGLPVTTHLCHHCVGSWQGISLCYEMRHTSDHRVDQVKRADNPHTLTHVGVQCSGCGVTPIAGARYQCTCCVDMVELCEDCHATSEAPLGHLNHHRFNVYNRNVVPLQEEVKLLVDTLFMDSGLQPKPGEELDDGFNKVKAILPVEHTLPPSAGNRNILVISKQQQQEEEGAGGGGVVGSEELQIYSSGGYEITEIGQQNPSDHHSYNKYVSEEEFVNKMMQSERVISLLTGFDIRHVKLAPYPESFTQQVTKEKVVV